MYSFSCLEPVCCSLSMFTGLVSYLTHFGKPAQCFFCPPLELHTLASIKRLCLYRVNMNSFPPLFLLGREGGPCMEVAITDVRALMGQAWATLRGQKRSSVHSGPFALKRGLRPGGSGCGQSRTAPQAPQFLIVCRRAEYLACRSYSMSLVGLQLLLTGVDVSGNRANP